MRACVWESQLLNITRYYKGMLQNHKPMKDT